MNIVTEASWPTFLILFTLIMLALYLARDPAHRAIKAIFIGLSQALRLLAVSFSNSASRLRERNREVLLNIGREHGARELRKEFHEISQFVQRDLGGYPQLQQDIRAQINLIQSDYEASQAASLELPEWTEAVDSVAKLKNNNQGANTKVLEQIHATAVTQHKDNLKTFRDLNNKRHSLLHRIMPYWRKLSFSIDDTGASLQEIVKRSERIDTHMARFNELHESSDKAVRFLTMSAITQFLISALVIAIAAGGAFFNFHLIALPMSEMVGSVQRVGGVKVSDLAALVIICMEMSAGIFLLESLRITKLFPLIGSMDDKTRRVIMATSIFVLLTLACTESALAFMRDQIANDLAALRSSLSGAAAANTAIPSSGVDHWIPLAANMVLGFVLPVALTMIAIPLEYLLQSGRTALGHLFANSVGSASVLLRMLASLIKQSGRVLISLYDLLIAGPLFIENAIKQRNKNEPMQSEVHGILKPRWAAQEAKNEQTSATANHHHATCTGSIKLQFGEHR